MMGFSCRHRSVSLLIFLIFVVLLLNAPAGRCGCYKRIFSFGDSLIDTGNFARSGPIVEYPFGMTYFHHPTGRISDGRVLIDFYAQAFQLPLIPPNLPQKDTGLFPTGANFAVFGSTAMPPEYFRRWSHDVSWACCLGVQMGWFKEMLQRIAPWDGAKRQILSESLIVLGEIGGNDYNFWFAARRPREQANQFIPDIVATIGSAAKELIGMGAKAIVIPNNFPIGCVPAYLSGYKSNNRADYDEHGCLRWFNDFSQRHNQALRGEVGRLRAQHPDVKLIYADYYGAAMEFIRDPHRFGIGDPLTACCGGDDQPYHISRPCNRMARLWGNPSGFASWDGMHMTEKAYDVISHGVLNGPFADPPLLRSC
ncbi:GDSL esterase/lipase At1g28600-like [Miscanthus floridulus]|uniref:GDSL esterase/lipase At1g28600-like n=1 Tax=Miscanthus floridulus TaxID=154761 RepID=UPI003458658F